MKDEKSKPELLGEASAKPSEVKIGAEKFFKGSRAFYTIALVLMVLSALNRLFNSEMSDYYRFELFHSVVFKLTLEAFVMVAGVMIGGYLLLAYMISPQGKKVLNSLIKVLLGLAALLTICLIQWGVWDDPVLGVPYGRLSVMGNLVCVFVIPQLLFALVGIVNYHLNRPKSKEPDLTDAQ